MNYKRLGNYIREVDVRNEDDSITNLLGINIDKYYIPSVANVVGTDLSRYKVVAKSQFACNRMHVGRDKRLPIALSTKEERFIVSPAYDVFEITDRDELLPEYLMMWFSRKEFDRNTWFYTDADVRGGLNWNTFLDMQLPIPSPEKQREIVAEYNAVQNRINLNNQLIQKLEETAQAIYKQWFVDFEFPNKEGKPYKNSGGEMMESEFGEVPKGWRKGKLKEIISFYNGKVKPSNQGKYPVYGGNGIVEYVDSYNDENTIIVGRVGAYCGSLFLEKNRCWISDNAISAKPLKNIIIFCLYTLHNLNLNERSEGTGQPLITQTILNDIDIIIPSEKVIQTFEEKISILNKNIRLFAQQNKKLTELQSLLLSKMARIEN